MVTLSQADDNQFLRAFDKDGNVLWEEHFLNRKIVEIVRVTQSPDLDIAFVSPTALNVRSGKDGKLSWKRDR